MGELGLRGSEVCIGGNGGRALELEGGDGLDEPEDGASDLARLACGLIGRAVCT